MTQASLRRVDGLLAQYGLHDTDAGNVCKRATIQ